MTPSPPIHVLATDLFEVGHHGQQARQTAEAILRYTPERIRLTLAVPPRVIEQQPGLHDLVAAYPGRFRLHPAQPPSLHTEGHVWVRNARNAKAHAARYRALVREHAADHLMLPYLDAAWPILATRRTLTSVPTTGIYFQPGFHYPLPDRTASVKQWTSALVRKAQKTLLARSALRHPALRALCTMDPYAVPTLRQWATDVHVHAVPDGTAYTAPSPDDIAAVRAAWGVEPGRAAWLCFGVLNERKGVPLALDALRLLPEATQRRLALVLAGRPNEPEQIDAAVTAARRTTAVQIVTQYGFVPEEAIEPTIAAADGLLLPYVRHVGSSGLQIRAAQAARPSINPTFGLMGRYVREYHLGLAVPTEGPGAAPALSAALAQVIEAPETMPFDPADAARFAAHHTPDRFARVVASTLLDGLGAHDEAAALRASLGTANHAASEDPHA